MTLKRLPAGFYQTPGGREPVREWLKDLNTIDRATIGQDIVTAEFGWPVGMPLCRPLGHGLFEIPVSAAVESRAWFSALPMGAWCSCTVS